MFSKTTFKTKNNHDLTCVSFPALSYSHFSECIHNVKPGNCFVSVSLSQSNVKSNQFALQPGLSRNVLIESQTQHWEMLFARGYVQDCMLMTCMLFMKSITKCPHPGHKCEKVSQVIHEIVLQCRLALMFSPRAKLRRILVLRLLWRLNRTEPLRNWDITPMDHSSGINFMAWKLEKTKVSSIIIISQYISCKIDNFCPLTSFLQSFS